MTFVPPPRGLRVLYLRDRLILHDISYACRAHPYDRNSLIDAANSVHHRQQSSSQANSLIHFDLPTHPAHTSDSPPQQQHRYLVLPFAPEHSPRHPPSPFEASTPEQAGLTKSIDFSTIPVDASAAFLGLLPLHSAVFAVLATQVRNAGSLPNGPILSISKVRLVRLGEAWQSKEDKDTASAVAKLLESGSLYYAIRTDLTLAAQRPGEEDRNYTFCWNFSLRRRLPQHLRQWTIRTIYGFVGTHIMRSQSDSMPSGMAEFSITVVSRRSRLRAGTRYITRGVDALGNVANSVETEQIVWREEVKDLFTSFVVIRGSVPVYWRQNNGIAKPSPELDDSLVASRRAFARHFDALKDRYGYVSAVSLVDQRGSEGLLANAFERHFELYLKPFDRELPPKLVAFDFHSHCAGKEYERGLGVLLDRVKDDISRWGFFLSRRESTESTRLQRGVFRVNCVDCLDRTNVVQSMIARVALSMQLEELFRDKSLRSLSRSGYKLYAESEDRYKHLWGDNADAVSKQYSGTGALKTDFTRTGKRSTTGVIGDGMKSVMRMYYKNFVDEGRQEVIDVLCGNVSIRRPASRVKEGEEVGQLNNGKDLLQLDQISSFRKSKSGLTSLWYSFEALRINAGGDKQQVFVELHDDLMSVVTSDGICLEFPRNTLVSWSKRDDGKPSDRKVAPAKLRLIYKPTQASPATASPLDLQFKGGTTARENFLRALISWSRPQTATLLARKPVRVRVISLLRSGEHRMADWGLAPEPDARDLDEIIALILPAGDKATRSWGLAAVPVDVDFSDYVLVGACATNENGPSIAVLTSKRIVPTVMMVSETTTTQRSSSSFAGGAAAIALQACGTSFCFVSARANGLPDLHAALASLRLGRQSFDVTNQFHHFTVAGLVGDMKWQTSNHAETRWMQLADGCSCYTLKNGLSIMRNSFPTLMYNDRLDVKTPQEPNKRSAGRGQPAPCTILEDGVVEGRSGPQLPKNLVKKAIFVSNLRGEDVMMPRGVEQASQMNCAVVLYCDLATIDGVATRPAQRASSYPEWRETLSLFMMPSDLNEIYDSFILGQIVVPTPLGDPISAGNFVLPISFAKNGNGDFDIPCRLAGKLTARLSGNIQVKDPWEITEDMSNLGLQRTELGSAGSMTAARNSLPPIPTYKTSQATDKGGPEKVKRRPHSTASPTADSLQAQARKKGAMEEMNGKLNAARRKGSKQMKSVVNKLSSFLNQPSSSPSIAPALSSRASSNPYMDTRNELPNVDREAFQNYNPRHHNTSSGTDDAEKYSGQVKERNTEQSSAGKAQGGVLKNNPPESFGRKDNLGFFGASQAAPDASSCAKRNGSRPQNPDPLLQALQGRQHSLPVTASQTVRPPTHFNEGGGDPLLSGLALEKDKTKSTAADDTQEDDEWGDFESAAAPVVGGPVNVTDRKSSRSGPSLLDL